MSELSVAVIIPTRGRDQCLRQVLRDLNEQDHPALEVWVVDQNDDGLKGLEAEIPKVRLVYEKMAPRGSHAGRNRAIFKTKAALCVFIDDDVRLSPHFVKAHVDAHKTYMSEMPAVRCVAGRVVQPRDGLTEAQMLHEGELARYHKLTGRVTGNFMGYDLGFVDHIHECNFSVQTELLKKVGGFNEEFQGNAYFEGTDLALRFQQAGAKIIYRPDIVLTHLQEGAGGNRVQEKSRHTYWFMRNLGLLNSLHMNRIGLPVFSAYGLAYVVGKAVKNKDPKIAIQGLRGMVDGLRYFLPALGKRKK